MLTAITTDRRRVTAIVSALILATLAAFAPVVRAIAAQPAPRVAFLARADNPVDALAASSVAAQAGGVVLLTRSSDLEQAARDGLADYQPDLVILAGGPQALSPQIEDDLDALGHAWERIGGDTRTDTARLIAERLATLDRAYVGVDGTAANSEKLQGRRASQLTRSASAQTASTALQPPVGTPFPYLQTTMEVPAPGWLVISGGATMQRFAEANVVCSLAVSGEGAIDGGIVDGSHRTVRLVDGPAVGSCQTGVRVQVKAGSVGVGLMVQAPAYPANMPNQATQVGDRSLVVQYVPFDGDGSAPPIDEIGG